MPRPSRVVARDDRLDEHIDAPPLGIGRTRLADPPVFGPKGPPLNARQGAARVGLSVPAFWKGVAEGRFPDPFYPASRSPRWYGAELDEAVAATRQKPREAKLRRSQRAAARRRAESPENADGR